MTFSAFLLSHGLLPKDVYASSKVQRCPTATHPRSDNGAYFYDGYRGWCMDWANDAGVNWWSSGKEWTAAEKRDFEQQRIAQAKRRREGHIKAAQRAAEIIKSCKPDTHNYLRSKQLPEVNGLVTDSGDLVVPMRGLDNSLQGAQIIHWNLDTREWEKKMIPGMRAKGAVLRIGGHRTAETWLCEGYATGLSVYEAIKRLRLNASVLVCFSDRNMVQVTNDVSGNRFVFADNDKSQAGLRAAQDTGLPYCMADTEGWDANDLHDKAGLMAVCKKIMEARM